MSALTYLRDRLDHSPTCSLAWIGKQLGHTGSDTALEDYVTDLITGAKFPPPLPHRRHGGGLSYEVSWRRSAWVTAAVVDWLGGFFPPETADALDEVHRRAAEDEMDRAAGNLRLQLVGGTEV